MSDEWIAGRAHGAISYNRYLDSSDVSVDVDDGAAVLSGVVSSDIERDLAQQITEDIEGVVSVENRIIVDPDLSLRSRPERIQRAIDATTTAAVRDRLLSNRVMHDMSIRITTKDGIVVLNGTVASLSQKESAGQIAFNTRDVIDVKNDLLIEDAKSRSEKLNNASVNISREISDSWITAKIRNFLLFSSAYSGSVVSVQTDKGDVVLEGVARSAAQRDEITKMVSDVVGVKTVANNLILR